MTRGSGFKPARRGVTLMELLVCVAVIGILAGLCVTGAAAARESARRVQCTNNLKQLGIAIANYESGSKCLPPSQNGRNFYSLFASMLAQLEEPGLYNATNFSIASSRGGPENLTVGQTSLAVLLCPADTGPPNSHAWTNYAGNEGFDLQAFGFNGSFVPTSGNSFVARKGTSTIGPGDFTDGASNTVSVSEWRLGPANVDASITLRSVYATDRLQKPEQFETFVTMCLRSSGAGRRLNNRGMLWFTGATMRTLYNHNVQPGSISCTNSFSPTLGAITAGSEHSGIVNALHADGHVKPVPLSISPAVWRAIGTRNGGEVVSAL